MHLLRTGAFLRAVRSAKVNQGQAQYSRTLVRPTQCHPQYQHSVQAERWSSTSSIGQPGRPRRKQIARQDTSHPSQCHSGCFVPARYISVGTAAQNKSENVSGNTSKTIMGQSYPADHMTNVGDNILDLVGRRLYMQNDHPLAITRGLIESAFPRPDFYNDVQDSPVVSTWHNFDVLGFPKDHPGRSKTDTYYIDSDHVLRTHSSAHQHTAFKALNAENKDFSGYTICADVYRRDSIDRTHFPVFHQMEGAKVWKLPTSSKAKTTRLELQEQRIAQIKADLAALPEHDLEVMDEPGPYNDQTNPLQPEHEPEESELVVQHLKRSLELLVQKVFVAAQAARPTEKREQLKVRWIEAYFPFTSPSFELEVFWQGEWLELLGCGVVKQTILNEAGLQSSIGWAWGLGIERLAMLLFEIPDIRLFWSQDKRFLQQFKEGRISRFEPFSKYPSCHKDVSFWIRPSPAAASPIEEKTSGVAAAAGGDSTKASPAETQPAAFHENDIMEIVRDVAGTLVEDVKLVDEFVSPKTGKKSLCYRINYRSNERTLTNDEVNKLHDNVLKRVAELPVDIR